MSPAMSRKRNEAAELERMTALLSESETLGRQLRAMAAVLSEFTQALLDDDEDRGELE